MYEKAVCVFDFMAPPRRQPAGILDPTRHIIPRSATTIKPGSHSRVSAKSPSRAAGLPDHDLRVWTSYQGLRLHKCKYLISGFDAGDG